MCILHKMQKFLRNSVNAVKNLNIQKCIQESNHKNGANCCGIHSVSYSRQVKRIEKGNDKEMVNFNDIVATRRAQAQQSILVQVSSKKSFSELEKYCQQYGTIVGAHHYQSKNDDNFILVEYSNELEAKEAIANGTFEEASGGRIRSPFLWFRAVRNAPVDKGSQVSDKLVVTDGIAPIDYNEIEEILPTAESLADQMIILYNSTKLNDLGIRLRFLAARQIEECMFGIFPKAEACIFGSSVNGYGKLGCDLDLILQLDSESEPQHDLKKRLIFHTKKQMMTSRSQVQRNLENIGETMQMYLPGVSNVRKILQARVPIIRYNHEHLELEVDLSMSNMSGFYMSELFYMFTQIDERVSPLVFSIRRWAQITGVTHSAPGFWISNFSLTCLVIFYLQQLKKPVLPPINSFIKQARPEDKRHSAEAELQCTFLRDLNLLTFARENTDTLDRLLFGFFEFYGEMDFSVNAISLNDGRLHIKPNASAVYVINPLEQSLNVTKNISFEECQRFRIEVRNALWALQSTEKKPTRSDRSKMWGLSNLFLSTRNPLVRPKMFFKPRMVELDGILGDKTNNRNDANIQIKNYSMKSAVAKIKKQHRVDLKELKLSERKM